MRIEILTVDSGRSLRKTSVASDADDDELRDAVCGALGEECEASGGVPWYVWPIGVLAVVGSGVAIGFIVESQRATVFCPPAGC